MQLQKIPFIGVLLLLQTACAILLNGQVKFDKPAYDMGLITGSPNDFIDIKITNTSQQKIHIFRTDADKKFSIQYSTKTLLPDSTVYIRVAYYPDRKGHFEESINIHFSCFNTPYKLHVEGMAGEVSRSYTSFDCPSFDKQRPNTMPQSEFIVKIIDSITREVLPLATLKTISNGLIRTTEQTNEYGVLSKKLIVGYYYLVAQSAGYYSNDFGGYINRNTKEIIIPLLKKEVPPTPIDEKTPEELIYVINTPKNPIKDTIEKPSEITTYITTITTETIENDPYPDFPLSLYKPNNIVFVIDISSSMKVEGRMDLLKAAMIQLTHMLRPIDKLTIITYSHKADILYDTQHVTNKDTILSIIQSLTPGGITDGGKGMKLGYEKALKAFIYDGNNQVIMTTDGAFNTGGDNVYTMAQKNAKKGVDMSIVGIKMKETDKKSMFKIAELGQGAFVEINKYDDTQNKLNDEIKLRSSKQKKPISQ